MKWNHNIRSSFIQLLIVLMYLALVGCLIPPIPINLPPNIESHSFNASEDISAGTLIGRVRAEDPEGNPIRYSIIQNSLSIVGTPLFSINPSSGDLILSDGQNLDYETTNSHSIVIQVSDGATVPVQANIRIAVTNVNEPPIVQSDRFTSPENIDHTMVIGTVQAVDPENDAISYRIVTSTSLGLFTIDSSTGALSVAAGQSLDYESSAMHTILIEVSAGGQSTSAEITIEVQIIDEAPVITEQSFSAFENIPDTDIIGTVTARDPGGRALNYSIENPAATPFEIAPNGMLSLKSGQSLDFEMPPNEHSITVQASNGTQSAVASITIREIDVNEPPSNPIIKGGGQLIVPENITSDHEIATITIPNPDANDPLRFSITRNSRVRKFSPLTYQDEFAELFHITPNGVLSLADGTSFYGSSIVANYFGGLNLDFEEAQSHSITVEVIDSLGQRASADFTITVTNVNEPPVFHFLPMNVSVREDIDHTHIIDTIYAVDPEGQPVSIRWESDLFTFVTSTVLGVDLRLREGQNLDYETATVHTISAEVSDGVNSTPVLITVRVIDVAEQPTLAFSSYSFSVSEDISPGASIGTIPAEDPNGDTLTYSVNPPSTLFEFDNANSGVLSLKAGQSLDSSVAALHRITVEATDGNTDPISVPVSIQVLSRTTVENSQPSITHPATGPWVYFVGNSITYGGDIPGRFHRLVTANGGYPTGYGRHKQHTPGGARLKDVFNGRSNNRSNSNVIMDILYHKPRYIVLQEQSNGISNDTCYTIPYYLALAQASSSEIVVYQTWHYRNPEDFLGLSLSYNLAMAPNGQIFNAIHPMPLLTNDDIHPNAISASLYAASFYYLLNPSASKVSGLIAQTGLSISTEEDNRLNAIVFDTVRDPSFSTALRGITTNTNITNGLGCRQADEVVTGLDSLGNSLETAIPLYAPATDSIIVLNIDIPSYDIDIYSFPRAFAGKRVRITFSDLKYINASTGNRITPLTTPFSSDFNNSIFLGDAQGRGLSYESSGNTITLRLPSISSFIGFIGGGGRYNAHRRAENGQFRVTITELED